MRLIPRSLIGQTMLAVAVALIVAQAISAVLLYRAAEQRRETALLNTAAFHLVAGASGPRSVEDRQARRHMRQMAQVARSPRRDDRMRRLPRRIRYTTQESSPLLPTERRDPESEAAIEAILSTQGVDIAELVVTTRSAEADPLLATATQRQLRLRNAMAERPPELLVVGLRRDGAAQWEIARVLDPPREGRILGTLLLQTIILVAVLMVLLWFVLRRITRPLGALAQSTRRFTGTGAPELPLALSGPEDIRRLITAHNAMQARIGSMLDEKDVMLGAIGHDLKTPLAALRVRIEGVENPRARAIMAATIEDITRTLDEILQLARIGRSDVPAERTELGALAASVVEEFEDMGEPVTMEQQVRIPAPVRITWVKRGLRNLITNALRYGGSAEITVLREGDWAVLRVEDKGPGIPEDRLAEMLEPFTRGEASRNRDTGGAGLGLALARAVAEQHGGTLVLANRPQGGLRAEFRLPTG
ncbi:ATP-binding protein [Qipengyuania sp. SM2507]